jgi:hypothetical protein
VACNVHANNSAVQLFCTAGKKSCDVIGGFVSLHVNPQSSWPITNRITTASSCQALSVNTMELLPPTKQETRAKSVQSHTTVSSALQQLVALRFPLFLASSSWPLLTHRQCNKTIKPHHLETVLKNTAACVFNLIQITPALAVICYHLKCQLVMINYTCDR